ncbi:MAG: tetratricopeptide repeat protein [Variovorax sp.]|nr:MAG: tetratricopeptide repeat protein [Variovorax sp.]
MRLMHLAFRLRAMGLLLMGRRGAAEAVFGRMLARWPDDAYALASRSFVRAQLGRQEAAIDDARRLVQVHPERSAGDWFNLAFLLESSDCVAQATDAFRRAVSLDPKLDRAWYGLGLALIRQGRLEEAVAALARNTELQPMSPYGWYQLARVHMDRHEPEEARKIIRHLQGFEPKIAAQLQRETGLAS